MRDRVEEHLDRGSTAVRANATPEGDIQGQFVPHIVNQNRPEVIGRLDSTVDRIDVVIERHPGPDQRQSSRRAVAIERGNGMEHVQDKLDELMPKNDAQRQALAQSQQIMNDLSQTRWLLFEEAQTPLPVPLLVILIFWLILLFVSFGLFAPRNLMALFVLFVVACSLSAAIFLILELNQPFDGFMKVSNAPLRNAMLYIGQ